MVPSWSEPSSESGRPEVEDLSPQIKTTETGDLIMLASQVTRALCFHEDFNSSATEGSAHGLDFVTYHPTLSCFSVVGNKLISIGK